MPRTQDAPDAPRTQPYGGSRSKRGKTGKKKEAPVPTSLTACKKQVRSVSRLLTRDTLDSAMRVGLERRLKALTILQSQLSNAQTDKANAARYHGIKFFERKKIVRKLAQVDRQLEAAEAAAKEQLEADKHALLVNLNYTTYYPDSYKYISLYPADPTKTTQETKQRQLDIQKSIALAMDSGDLPRDPRTVDVEDRKAIRKSTRMLLRSVSQAHGEADADEQPDSAAEENDADDFFE